jgi:hypothetical protein
VFDLRSGRQTAATRSDGWRTRVCLPRSIDSYQCCKPTTQLLLCHSCARSTHPDTDRSVLAIRAMQQLDSTALFHTTAAHSNMPTTCSVRSSGACRCQLACPASLPPSSVTRLGLQAGPRQQRQALRRLQPQHQHRPHAPAAPRRPAHTNVSHNQTVVRDRAKLLSAPACTLGQHEPNGSWAR